MRPLADSYLNFVDLMSIFLSSFPSPLMSFFLFSFSLSLSLSPSLSLSLSIYLQVHSFYLSSLTSLFLLSLLYLPFFIFIFYSAFLPYFIFLSSLRPSPLFFFFPFIYYFFFLFVYSSVCMVSYLFSYLSCS